MVLELELGKNDLEKEIESLNKNVMSVESDEHVSGLKRQIKSLKQHNIALERKLDTESREALFKLREKDVQLRIKEFELEKFRNPTQTSIRGVFSELIPGFGRKGIDNEKAVENIEGRNNAIEESGDGDAETKSIDSEQDPSLKNEAESSIDLKEDTIEDIENDKEESKKTAGTGTIWNLFSPRKELSRTVKKDKNIGFSLSNWDSKFSGDLAIGKEENERESAAKLSDELVNECSKENEEDEIEQMKDNFTNGAADEKS